MEPRLLSGRASRVGELRRTCPFSSTKVEAEPIGTGAVMVEGRVGGSNEGRKVRGGWRVEGRDEQKEGDNVKLHRHCTMRGKVDKNKLPQILNYGLHECSSLRVALPIF